MNITPVIKNFVNKPSVMKFASDPKWPVAGLIVSNMVFRPAFTLLDSKTKPAARKYSAAREFFHQVLCLGALFALADGFKNLGFKAGKALFGSKVGTGFDKFANFKELSQFLKKGGDLIASKHYVLNGSLAVGSIIGSIVALAIVAPKLNNWLLPPLLNKLGIKLDNPEDIKKPAGIYAKSLNMVKENGQVKLPQNFTAKDLQAHKINISA